MFRCSECWRMFETVKPHKGDTHMEPRYPQITVQLTGTDGNAFAVLGKVRAALRKAGVPAERVAEFTAVATAGDYDHLLSTCTRWVNVT